MAESTRHDGNGDNIELYSLLSRTIDDWSIIYNYIKHHPRKARCRYYRNESPLQLALKARERRRIRERVNKGGGDIGRLHVLQALVDADPTSIHSRDNEGKCHRCIELSQLLTSNGYQSPLN